MSIRTTRLAARLWKHDVAVPSRSFICADCRMATRSRRSETTQTTTPMALPITSPSSARSFHTQTRLSSTPQHDDPPATPPPTTTHYDFFPETFPHGPPPTAAFSPDLRQLRREYLQLQARAHPDLAAPGARSKKRAEALSMRINEAYRTLQDPLRRAQYLLGLRGVDVADESAKLADAALLMEVMEAREAVDAVEDEEALAALGAENTARVDESVRVLEEAFARADVARAAEEAVRLRYWMNIEESIQGWEKGKGGGLTHH